MEGSSVTVSTNISQFSFLNATIVPTPNRTEALDGEYGAVAYRYVALIVFPIIIIVSIAGNSLVISLTAKFHCVNGSVNTFIIHKAFCNIIISTLPTSLFIVETLSKTWPFGSVTCNAIVVIEYAVLTTSNLILVIQCREQYIAVVKPFRKQKRRNAKLALLFAWTVGWPIAIPFVIFQSRYLEHGINGGKPECSDLWVFTPDKPSTNHFIYFILIFTLFVFVPLVAMIGLYSRIIYEFVYKMKRPGIATPSIKERARKRKWNTIKLLVTSVILFQICWLPSFVHEIVLYLRESNAVTLASLATSVAGYAYGAINPFIYFCFVGKYRQSFRIEMRRWFRPRLRLRKPIRQNSMTIENIGIQFRNCDSRPYLETAVIAGEEFITLVLDDPVGNSYIQNPYSPDEDPDLNIEKYERTFDQNEQLGLNDINTQNSTDVVREEK
eukprot:gene11230-12409_t